MEYSIKNLIDNLTISEPQRFKNLSVFPVSFVQEIGFQYISLETAITNKHVTIKEIDESGRVNSLLVVNDSDNFVLLLDGEELIGAKQNRVLNTSILLDKRSKTVIPVSCVEAGRWQYRSRDFQTSDRIMSAKIKSRKMEDVSMNLKVNPQRAEYRSNQGRVWDEVNNLLEMRKAYSASSAMSEAFDSSASMINDYLNAYKISENQNGVIVAMNGSIIGFEFISNSEVFKSYFPKLMRGFAIDAISENVDKFVEADVEKCKEFVNNLDKSIQSSFPSVGLGHSFRYESGKSIAAALVFNNGTIHFSQLKKEAQRTDFKVSDRINR